jgi:hypothetical protein
MSNQNNNHQYDDIINLPHHTSAKHPRMSAIGRAAQFSPFAALTGYDAAVKEITDQRIELDEYEKVALDDRLRFLQENFGKAPKVKITYFAPDMLKDGGAYLDEIGVVKKMKLFELVMLGIGWYKKTRCDRKVFRYMEESGED